jgi:hypothetical protein
MNIYKLQYTDQESATYSLIETGVLGEFGYHNTTQAIVSLGKLVKVQATYDENGEELTPPIYYDGIFYDVMTEATIDFGENEIFPENESHGFAGHVKPEATEEEEIIIK